MPYPNDAFLEPFEAHFLLYFHKRDWKIAATGIKCCAKLSTLYSGSEANALVFVVGWLHPLTSSRDCRMTTGSCGLAALVQSAVATKYYFQNLSCLYQTPSIL